MARRWKKDVRFYDYQCTLTGEKFRLYRESKNTSELISIKAFYELHPERDDRPEVIKKKLATLEVSQPSLPGAPNDSPDAKDSEQKAAEDSANGSPKTDETKPADTGDLPPEKPPTPTA